MIISIHIPKTAGTTFRNYLHKVFDGGVLHDYGLDAPELNDLFDSSFPDIATIRDKGYFDIRLLSEGILEFKQALRSRRIRAIHGHFDINKYLGIFPRATYLVWLRDPLERALSHYQFLQRILSDPTDETNSSIYYGRLSFDDWMLRPENINLQYRLTLGDLTRFHFVGITEQFDRSLSVFRKIAGLDQKSFDFPAWPENVNPRKRLKARYKTSKQTREQFTELNQADIVLYNEAVARVNAF